MKMSLVVIAILLAPAAFCAQYGVQIGAYAEAEGDAMEAAGEVGPIVSWQTEQGLTLFAVAMADEDAALQAVPRLQDLGYAGAFVKQLPVSVAGSASPTVAAGTVAASDGARAEHLDLLEQLSSEERDQLVYLDGKPHLKNGDVFTPLR